jgi:hypothetical protein
MTTGASPVLGSYRHCGAYGPLDWNWGLVVCQAPTGTTASTAL